MFRWRGEKIQVGDSSWSRAEEKKALCCGSGRLTWERRALPVGAAGSKVPGARSGRAWKCAQETQCPELEVQGYSVWLESSVSVAAVRCTERGARSEEDGLRT